MNRREFLHAVVALASGLLLSKANEYTKTPDNGFDAEYTGPIWGPGMASLCVDWEHGDDANDGLTWDTPLRTIAESIRRCSNAQNDTVFVVG